ncbi:MAG: hypothetical protein PQJ45_11845 [Sphaerochaetaceae bacterium]|nr:hypothetical protein [Sphaerochaetaceae bacterium]
MNKKILLFTLILFTNIPAFFANDTSLVIYNNTILPISNKIGMINSINSTESERYFKEMFEEDFNLEWIDKYIMDDYKYSFTKENSKFLAQLLPIKGSIYVGKMNYKPSNRTISVLIENNLIVQIIIDKNIDKIISMKFISSS